MAPHIIALHSGFVGRTLCGMDDILGKLFDDADMEIPCPKCGKQFTEKLGTLKNSSNVKCPHCGIGFAPNTEEFSEQMEASEKAVEDFGKGLKKI